MDSTLAPVRQALLGIGQELPDSVHACVFNLVYDDDLEAEVAIVVMILAYQEWDKHAEDACERASDLAWAALSSLGVIADVICRTQAEHEQVREAEEWMTLDEHC